MQIKTKSPAAYMAVMWLIIILSMVIAVLFCCKKQGYHFDENYSYYSTNISYGLWPTDNEWKDVQEIRDEFVIRDGEPLNFGLVKTSQSYDVHPPLYYYVLRVVCFLSKNVFSKWQGLAINLVFYLVCLILLWQISDVLGAGNKYINAFTLLLFGLSPGYLSTVTFVRMYVMLTMECFAILLLVMKNMRDDTWTWKKSFIPAMIITCLGFLTHYYFIVFVFFVAAYTCIYLVIRKDTRVKAFIFGGSICVGLGLAVVYYPVCLSHIFSGYRGNEATQAFADASNTLSRINFFVQILNDFTFSNCLYGLVLIILLYYVLYMYRRKTGKVETDNTENANHASAVKGLFVFVTTGYFLLVSKTGIMPSNPAEALRYECPSYGLIILMVVALIVGLTEKIGPKYVGVVILCAAVVFQIVGLTRDKVFFIYDEAVECYQWAEEHKEADIAFVYNDVNSWMIWNDSTELMTYDKIFFISMQNEDKITDPDIAGSDKLYVYACRSDDALAKIQEMVDLNNNFDSYELVEERLFVDIYELK